MNKIEAVKKLVSQKKGRQYIATKLNIPIEEVDSILGSPVKSGSNYYLHTDLPLDGTTWKYQTFHNVQEGTFKSEVVADFEPKDDLELAELHKVDLTKYRISSYWTKQHGEKFTSSLLCTLIKPSDFSLEDFSEYVKGYKSTYKPITKLASSKETADVEISLADFHLDKLDINKETIEDRVGQYKTTLFELLSRITGSFNVNKMVFVIGNDFLHTDTIQNTTTKGTPLTTSCTWNEAYEVGFDLLVEAISTLLSVSSEVEVILVQGNHARTKEYFLAHALATYFQNEKRITFQRDFTTLKHVVLGNTFIGYHHGDTKIMDLPLIFATSPTSSADFGNAVYRECHVGDKHFYLAKEVQGVRVHQVPSLSGTDSWHRDHNFVNSIRCGLAMVYSPIYGKVAEYESRL